jgi:hypothetical protein
MDERALRRYFKEQFDPTFEGGVEALLPVTWTEEMEQQRGTLRPTVVIGIGGSGVKPVARLKRRIRTFYRGEAFEAHRRAIQYVVMDTLPYDKMLREDPEGVTREISSDEYIYLGGFNPAAYLDGQQANADLRLWWDDRYRPAYTVIEDGAERSRQLGRLALYRSKERVRAAIANAITRAITLHGDLVREGRARGIGGDEGQKIYIYIFSGTCGGTGSGMVLDVAYMAYAQVPHPNVPDLRLVLFMPRPFVQMARGSQSGEEWKTRALQANAYAFFKELQYFASDGPRIVDWRLDASTRRGMDPTPPQQQPLLTERIYLVDTEISGREITGLPDLYTLGADYIFHLMATPIGQQMESAAVNLRTLLAGAVGGRPAAFSSVGSSYIIYPAKTLARCASSAVLKRSLDRILSALPETEAREKAASLVAKFLSEGQRWCDPIAVDSALFEGSQAFASAVPTAPRILQQAESQSTKVHTAMVWAEQIEEEQERLGLDRVDASARALLGPGALAEVSRLLRELVSRVGEVGVEVVREALRQILSAVEKRRHENWPDGPSRVERDALELINQVRKLEEQWLVIKRKEKVRERVERYAQLLREEVILELRGRAARHREEFFKKIIELIEDEGLPRLRRIRTALEAARDMFGVEEQNYNATTDESAVSVTTQYVPGAPDRQLVEQLLTQIDLDVDRLHTDLFQDEEMKTALWELSATEEATVTEGIRRFLRVSLDRVSAAVASGVMSKKVTDVILEQWPAGPRQEEFKQTYGHNLEALADPSWAVSTDAIPATEQPRSKAGTTPALAMPERPGFDASAYFPAGLLRQPPLVSGDPRVIQVMVSEHAVPLFAVRNVASYRAIYEQWLDQWHELRDSPPHISRAWNDPRALEGLERVEAPGTQEQRAFVHGMFLDWLIAVKADPRATSLFAPGSKPLRGPVYQAGRPPRFMYAVWRENVQGQLTLHGEAELAATPHRWEAARAINERVRDAVDSVREKVDQVIPERDYLRLLDEYQDHLRATFPRLPTLLARSEAERARELAALTDSNERALYKQLLEEMEILDEIRRG